MSKSLIIVESPAKMKTLKKFLGDAYILESSVGHIRDLPEKEFGIDIENEFEPKYVTMPEKEKVINSLKKAAKNVDTVYLSPDPDREGEAIAWHIMNILPKGTVYKRISFNSITKDAVLKALQFPRDIDMALVDAQQARRLLDRIVGYKISPILNRRIQRGRDGGVSAGRVQSVALKLVVDREAEIEAFIPVEYWNLAAILKAARDSRSFKANLYSVDGQRVEKEAVEGKNFFLIPNKETADQVIERMQSGPFTVQTVVKKEKKRNPVPPFITSTLQQEASRHHGYSSAKTMNIAQSLYEGIDLGNEGAEGLITYMRTDSVRVAPEALSEVRKHIKEVYGKDFLPESAKMYTTKKAAQDAHEAIRPTNLAHTPEHVKSYLTREQYMLYKLIWQRFVASQMNPAIYDTVSADISAGSGIIIRATGSVIKFQGFLAVYEEMEDDVETAEDGKILPPLEEGMELTLLELTSDQAFTRPPPRFTEASLVKELEKSGIGRPSTYASIMNKIQGREYTIKENSRLKPTELGRVIAQMLETNFPEIMNIGFTAQMEDDLELIASNEKDWKKLIKDFWESFYPTLEEAEKNAFVPKILTDIDCPECGSKLQKVWFKSKYFYGCSSYPDCSYSAPAEEILFNKEDYAEGFNWEQKCPLCQSEMKVRHGRFGAFLGCTKYPECRGIINIPKKGEEIINPEDLPPCPATDCTGQIVARKSRFGKTFFSCSSFPDCDVIVNDLTQLQSKYVDHPRTPYVKKTKKGKRGRPTKADKEKGKKTQAKKKRNVAPSALSPELAEIVGSHEATRGDALKSVWAYIKSNKLQDPENKRVIKPDEKLGKVFGNMEPVDMFKIAGILSQHIGKKD
ncbi:DNA topoisomerase 1 [Waddlia chondrophila 2032/99]|uniref:DNA topoisomerase 1 n=1 Tax=Waddlia chondrophila 2032/99 TaxID=765953 RepID=F8LFA1_9BACT|nr:DNA topoisomerase 1 [Waddlia chondrophila 2032/99]